MIPQPQADIQVIATVAISFDGKTIPLTWNQAMDLYKNLAQVLNRPMTDFIPPPAAYVPAFYSVDGVPLRTEATCTAPGEVNEL